VATSLMILIVLFMAFGAYTFLSQGQERVRGETERVELETVNATCLPDSITWWVNNTGEYPVDSSTADLFVYGGDGLNSTLSETGIPVEGFTRAYGSEKVKVSPSKDLGLGSKYSLELEAGNTRISTSCTAGSEWWDANWDYRRALDIDVDSNTTVEMVLDAEKLIGEGKMRQDCEDIRAVNKGEVLPTDRYEVVECDPSGAARVEIEIQDTEPGQAYVYYGNLGAN